MFLWCCKEIYILSHYYESRDRDLVTVSLVRVIILPVGFLSQVISAINTQQLTTFSVLESALLY